MCERERAERRQTEAGALLNEESVLLLVVEQIARSDFEDRRAVDVEEQRPLGLESGGRQRESSPWAGADIDGRRPRSTTTGSPR